MENKAAVKVAEEWSLYKASEIEEAAEKICEGVHSMSFVEK